jgi:two-component system response regulator AtoC
MMIQDIHNPEGESRDRLLIIDDEENMRHMLATLLTRAGYRVDTAIDGHNGLEMLEESNYDVILCDLKMPRMDGMEFLKAARSKIVSATVIMMSAYGTIDTAIEAMKLGAYDYISKPFKTDEVCLTLKKAEERERLKRENRRLRERIQQIEGESIFGKMVAQSAAMQSVFELAKKVSQYDTTVLITGESGTGKEMMAKGIHFGGKRSDMPIIPVNCGGIPENLLESELFGFKKGAFTGAEKDKKGLFEEAEGGTIFLDEIGELPLALQVKLLRVLQDNEVRPLGDAKTKRIDARVIAATSKHLDDEIKAGTFRQDLFYRLNVLSIKLPSLRERPEDIPLLCRHFIERFNRRLNKNITEITPEAMSVLLKYGWPGNVRELEHVIERAFVLAEESILRRENFSIEPEGETEAETIHEKFEGYSLKEAQKVIEKKLIAKALTATDGNRTKASQLLEISHPSLLSKIKAYDIDS